jgi:hypothetical protein
MGKLCLINILRHIPISVFFDQMTTDIGGAATRPILGFVEVLTAFAIECTLIIGIICNECVDDRRSGSTVGTARRDAATIISTRLRFGFVLNFRLKQYLFDIIFSHVIARFGLEQQTKRKVNEATSTCVK